MSLIPLVPITLDRERQLRYTMASLTRLEGVAGKPFGEIVAEHQRGSVTALVQIVWAGLIHEDQKLTTAKVADVLELHAMPVYAEAVAKAISLAFGQQQDGQDAGNGQAQSPTG